MGLNVWRASLPSKRYKLFNEKIGNTKVISYEFYKDTIS